MAKEIKFRLDGQPDGRGRSEGSTKGWFEPGDGRERPGRRKGSISLRKIYEAVGNGKIAVTQGNKTRMLTKKEAIVLKQAELALKGQQRPAERLLDKLEQYDPIEVRPDLTAELLREDQDLLDLARLRGLIPGRPVEDPDPTSQDDDVADIAP